MTRRFIALLLAALPACGGDSQPAAGSTGGTLVVAAPGDADLLLPPVTATQLGAHVVEQIFPQLAEITAAMITTEDSGYTPSLAESWEHRDSVTIAFHLDPRARWSDAVPITATDVEYTFEVYRDSLTGSPYRVNLDPIASVTAENEHTVVFRFHRAYPEQLYDATYHLRILPRHLLDTIPNERLASSAFARDPVGAGPFRFASWQPGAEIAVEADTTWFLGRPLLDRIVWRVMPDVSSAVTALLAGEADAMETIPLRDEIERVARDTAFALVPYASPFLGGLIFNLRRAPFGDREVRRALAMAIDRATIVEALFGPWGEVPVGAVSRMVWIAGDGIAQLPLDTAAAARALDAAGWRLPPGSSVRSRAGRPLRFRVLYPTTSRIREQTAVLMQDQLRRIGVDMRIEPAEFAVYDRRARAGDFDALMYSRTIDPSPSNLAQYWTRAAIGSGDNFGGYSSAAFDSLYAAASSAPDPGAALPLWRAALELLNLDAPAVHIYAPRNQAAIHRRFVNVAIRPDSWLATAATWSVAPERRLPRDR